MRRIHFALATAVLALALSSCGINSMVSWGGSSAGSGTCTPSQVSQAMSDVADKVRAALEADGNVDVEVSAVGRGNRCSNLDGKLSAGFTPGAIDYRVVIADSDPSEAARVGQRARSILEVLDDNSPDLPGTVVLVFDQGTGQLTLTFTRTQMRQALDGGLSGPDLMAKLGYPPTPAQGACAVVWKRQPLTQVIQQIQDDLDRSQLSDVQVSVEALGQSCADRFTPVETDIHIYLAVYPGDKSQFAAEAGHRIAGAFDVLLARPATDFPGAPQVPVTIFVDSFASITITATLGEARQLRSENLDGAALMEALQGQGP